MSHRNRPKLNALAIGRVAASRVKYLAPKRGKLGDLVPCTLGGSVAPCELLARA